jgi:hypothetical protein
MYIINKVNKIISTREHDATITKVITDEISVLYEGLFFQNSNKQISI